MSASDLVDDNAMIFTEADVYLIAGFLSEIWGVFDSAEDTAADTENAITQCLAIERPWRKT